MMKVDLRSDTVTKPTSGMLKAMMKAEVGDDVFIEDPTVTALEDKAAGIFGKEAGIFCPSGTMTNQIAIRLHTRAGGEVICHEEAHVYQYEAGGIAFNSGCSIKLIRGNRGRIEPAQILPAINPDDVHKPRTNLVCLEDTSNRGGGCVYDFDDIREITKICRKQGLPLHLDGARVFNALAENQIDTKVYGESFDTISICLSKGLGAPVGSVLLGSKHQIKEARRIRKVFGGGMRQVGYIAAAGIYALDHHIDRLKEDHERAKRIESTLKDCSFVSEIFPVETNIVVFRLQAGMKSNEFLEKLKTKGILAVPFAHDLVRFTTHLDLSDEAFEYFLQTIKTF